MIKRKIKNIANLNLETFRKNDFPETIKYLDTGNLTKNKIEDFKVINTLKDKVPSRAQRKVRNDTILYSTVRPNQEHYGFVEEWKENVVVSTGFTTIDVFDKSIYPKYLYYLLTQKHITDYLHLIGTNSVSSYPSISPNDLANLKFQFPKLTDQKKIADTLSSLNNKIELNNQINSDLEAMAKLVYDYWFVQFDFPIPARDAKAMGKPELEGKPYKASGGKMVFNEALKREIPEGWGDGILSDIADITMGQSPSGRSYNINEEGTVFYQGSTDFGWRFPTIR
ncbi:MAG: restriction endonuclease subunit S [Mesonia sp.]